VKCVKQLKPQEKLGVFCNALQQCLCIVLRFKIINCLIIIIGPKLGLSPNSCSRVEIRSFLPWLFCSNLHGVNPYRWAPSPAYQLLLKSNRLTGQAVTQKFFSAITSPSLVPCHSLPPNTTDISFPNYVMPVYLRNKDGFCISL
jgi:hypothetical protein